MEKKYRNKYIKYARNTGTILPWIDITFPNSTGKYSDINETNFIETNPNRLKNNSKTNNSETNNSETNNSEIKKIKNKFKYLTIIIAILFCIIFILLLLIFYK